MMIRRLNDWDDHITFGRAYEATWRFTYQGIIPQNYPDEIHTGR